jgi:hypothetical protein
VASLTNGTVALSRYRCWAPPSEAEPQPAMVKVPVLYCVVVAIFSVGRW